MDMPVTVLPARTLPSGQARVTSDKRPSRKFRRHSMATHEPSQKVSAFLAPWLSSGSAPLASW
jgi:hypothetical protein